MTIIIFFTALFGAVLGSFANVVIIRWHEEAPLGGRSNCPNCKKTIRPRHLVPVFSWIFLRGRCADCDAKIHIQYPIVEAIAVLFAVIAALRHDPLTDTWPFVFELVVSIGLIVPVGMDIRWKELPVEYLSGIGVFAFLFHAILTFSSIFGTIVAIAGASAFFALQFLLSRGKWIGEGDILFGAMMGAILATPLKTGIAIYLAYILGGFFALVGLVFKLYRRGSHVPFAPALAAGTLLTIWHGDLLITWITRGWL